MEARFPGEVFSTEVGHAELARRLEQLGSEESCAVLDELAQWLLVRARGSDPSAMLTDVRLSLGPRPESMRVDLEVAAAAGHSFRSLRTFVVALRESALSGATELYHLHLRRTDRQEAAVRFLARDVPGYGYRCFALVPAGHDLSPNPLPAREVRRGDSRIAPTMPPSLAEPALRLSKGEGAGGLGPTIENEFFAAAVDPTDGTLSITDKERGTTLRGLHQFVDGGDAGDEYNYAPPAEDEAVIGFAAPPAVTLVEDGPARWTLRVEGRLDLPRGLTPDRRRRSPQRVCCSVTSYVSLAPGVRRVDIRTEIDNQAEDHRLRVLFPTPVQTGTSSAEGHFGVVQRSTAVPESGTGWLEDPVATYPQKSFVDVCDGNGGLLVANQGLPEFEALPAAPGIAVALALLRCVGWLSRDDLPTRRGYAGPALPTPGAQCPGRSSFAYALVPHAGGWETAMPEAHRFTAPLRAQVTDAHPGRLPHQLSFLQVEPDQLVVSAVKLPEHGEGVVVRVYNPCEEHVDARLRWHQPFHRAEQVTLEEQPLEQLAWDAATLDLPVRPAEILTLRVTFRASEPE